MATGGVHAAPVQVLASPRVPDLCPPSICCSTPSWRPRLLWLPPRPNPRGLPLPSRTVCGEVCCLRVGDGGGTSTLSQATDRVARGQLGPRAYCHAATL